MSDILINGTSHQHATVGGMTIPSYVSLSSPDVSLIGIGNNPTVFPTPLGGIDVLTNGAYFTILNQVWGTNYPMWIPLLPEESNIVFRFRLRLDAENNRSQKGNFAKQS